MSSKKEKKMKLWQKVSIGVAAFVVVFGIVLAGGIIGVFNDCAGQENGIKAQYSQNQNNYDNYFKKLKETAQVPSLYTNDLRKVYDGAITSRYGATGSKAVFQFIAEHNPNFDSSLYKQIQQVIESGRNDFEANQKTLLDKKRVYENTLTQFPSGVVAKVFGFPKIDLAKYDIVTSDVTEQAFATKKSDPISLK